MSAEIIKKTRTHIYLKTLDGKEYRLPKCTYYHLTEAKNRTDQKLDALIIVTGPVGSGKSNKSMGLGGTWENHFFSREYELDKVHFSATAVSNEMDRDDNYTEVVNFDEAIQGGSSSGGITKVGKVLRSKLITKRFKKHLTITTVDSLKELNDKIIERCVAWYHVYYIRKRDGTYSKGHFKVFGPEQALKVYEDLKDKKCRDTMKHPLFMKNILKYKDDDFTNLWYTEKDYDDKKSKETSEQDDKEITLNPKHVYFWNKKVNDGISYNQMAKEYGIPSATIRTWSNKVIEIMANPNFEK